MQCSHGVYAGDRTDGRSEHCELCWNFPLGRKYDNGVFLGVPREDNIKPLSDLATINHVSMVDDRRYSHPIVEDNYGERSFP